MNKLILSTLEDYKLSPTQSIGAFNRITPDSPKRFSKHQHQKQQQQQSSNNIKNDTKHNNAKNNNRNSTKSLPDSEEDLTKLCKKLKKVDLGLDGRSELRRISTILTASKSFKKDKNNLRLISLQRTLKDKEQQLSTLDELLSLNVVTSSDLRTFCQKNSQKLQHAGLLNIHDDGDDDSKDDEDDGGNKTNDADAKISVSDDYAGKNCRPYETTLLLWSFLNFVIAQRPARPCYPVFTLNYKALRYKFSTNFLNTLMITHAASRHGMVLRMSGIQTLG
ncbi:hypothetical protein HELRODRAFT_166198 [Helobdella robusta]|uniref:Uncharacterized protein n=1 Tax=Helobdella robusta TaxID=6412 RepID=T1EXW2_HELRO|nr:hypothetical protein HELRODRAFT_166198 [Helobdella robusta]ESN90524.1 hypothetical protein HELRODRAFT_166198 [Helobdella robusta]